MLKPVGWEDHGGSKRHPPDCVLAEKSDYDNGDPDLTIEKHGDDLYAFVIYKGIDDLTVHGLTAAQVREAAKRILTLVPESK